MTWRGRGGGLFAFITLVLGVLIVFTLVIPPGFWWFLIGTALISFGWCKLRAL